MQQHYTTQHKRERGISSQDVCQSVINYFIRTQILMKPHTCMIQASVDADLTQQCTNPGK